MSSPLTFDSQTLVQLSQTAADWVVNGDYIPALNQICYETDTRKGKTGDGSTTYAALAYDTLDGSPFTGDAIVALDTANTADAIPCVEVITGATATAAGEATAGGTFAAVATGYYEFGANPSNGDALPPINGINTPIIFTTTQGQAFPYITIADNLAGTLVNLAQALTANAGIGVWVSLRDLTFTVGSGIRLLLTSTIYNTTGNAVTLGADTANITRSAATLVGGSDAATISIGNKVYTVVNASDPNADEIAAGDDKDAYAGNIALKVTADTADTFCTATDDGNGNIAFTANDEGADGNDITFETTDPNLILDAGFTGGITGGNFLSRTTGTQIAQGSNGLQNIATAAGTTTLIVNSPPQTRFTGSTTQTVVLPVVTTLKLGYTYTIINASTGLVTVNSSGANLVQTVAPGATVAVVCIAVTGTDATSWRVFYDSPGVVPRVIWDDDIVTTQGDVGKGWDAPLGQTGGFSLTIDDSLVYDAGACWTGSNLSNSTLIVTLADTPANLYLMDGGIVSNGAMDVPPGSSFVVCLTADLTKFIISGNNLSVA